MRNNISSILGNMKNIKWLTIWLFVFTVLLSLRFLHIIPFLQNSFAWFLIETVFAILFYHSIHVYRLYNKSIWLTCHTFVCVIWATLDGIIFDSGFFFIYAAILFSILIGNTSDCYIKLSLLLIINAITLELLSIFAYICSNLIETHIFLRLLSSPIIDIWLFLTCCQYCFIKYIPLHHMFFSNIISKFIPISISCFCLIIMLLSTKFRLDNLYIDNVNTSLNVPLYFTDASNPNFTLTNSSTGVLSMSHIAYDRDQAFFVADSEEESYYHIVSQDDTVLDVLNVLFTEDNDIICYPENGVIGQHWLLIPHSNGGFILQSHDNNFYATYDISKSTLCLTNDISRATTFVLQAATPMKFPPMGVITYTHRAVILAGYSGIMIVFLLLEIYLILSKMRQ